MCSFVSDLKDQDQRCRGGACDKFPPASKQTETNKPTQRSKLRPLMKNCLNSKDPSCARQEPRKVASVTKLRKPFRKPFTAFRNQRGPFRRPRITTTTRSPVTFDSNKTENDNEQTEKNMSDKDDEEDRRPKQLKSIPNDGNYEKPDNNRKINNKNKDNKTRNNNNKINIYDDDEEPTPEPEPSHHGDPRHHAFHSCKFISTLKNHTFYNIFSGLYQKIDPKVREARRKKFFGRHRRKRDTDNNIIKRIMNFN